VRNGKSKLWEVLCKCARTLDKDLFFFRRGRKNLAGTEVHALVVDDIAENREVLSLMLTLIGCDMTVAESGEEAFDLIRVAQPTIGKDGSGWRTTGRCSWMK
jgi:hypothetical protein